MKCGNNLKQIGIAMHMHNDTLGKLPAGWRDERGAGPSPPAPRWSSGSWLILPYIEQQALYTTINADLLTPGAPWRTTALPPPVAAPVGCSAARSDNGPQAQRTSLQELRDVQLHL